MSTVSIPSFVIITSVNKKTPANASRFEERDEIRVRRCSMSRFICAPAFHIWTTSDPTSTIVTTPKTPSHKDSFTPLDNMYPRPALARTEAAMPQYIAGTKRLCPMRRRYARMTPTIRNDSNPSRKTTMNACNMCNRLIENDSHFQENSGNRAANYADDANGRLK